MDQQKPPRRFDQPPGSEAYYPLPVARPARSEVERLLSVVKRRRGLIVTLMIIGTGLAMLVGAQIKPTYTARAALVIEPQQARIDAGQSLIEEAPADRAFIETQASLITSKEHRIRVAAQLRGPEAEASVVELNPAVHLSHVNLTLPETWQPYVRWLPDPWLLTLGLAEERVFGEARAALAEDAPVTATAVADIEQTAARIERGLRVSREGRSAILDVAYTDANPNRAARVANAIVDEFVRQSLEQKRQGMVEARRWLELRVTSLSQELEAAEAAVEQFRQDNDLIDVGATSLTDLALSDLTRDIIEADFELRDKEERLAKLRTMFTSGADVSMLPEVISSPVFLELWRQDYQLTQRETELRAIYGERHPTLQTVVAEKQTLDAKMQEEVRRIIANLDNEIGLLQSRLASLEAAAGSAKGETIGDRNAGLRLRELERNAESLRSLYESFLHRFQEAREQELIQRPDARVVSRATAPDKPSSFGLMFFGLFGLTLSSAFAVGIAVLSDQLDRRLRSGKELENEFGLPCLSLVPRLGRGEVERHKGLHRYVTNKPSAALSEAVGVTFTQLQLMETRRTPRIIQVTSAVPNEGKSSFAGAFAASLASAGHRTFLLDLDLRHPSVARSFGVATDEELQRFLAGDEPLYIGGQHDAATGITVASQHHALANPPSLLKAERLRTLLDTLSQRYDIVVVDSPPVLGVRDSRLISSVVDAVLFLVRWESTSRDVVEDALKQLREVDAPLAGFVLSIVDVRRQARYGYGGLDSYYAKYGKYYAN
ncbi:MAG: GumC family protein [Geminicoccaceae bacterium]